MNLIRITLLVALSVYLGVYSLWSRADDNAVITIGVYGEKYNQIRHIYWDKLAKYISKRVDHHEVKIKQLTLEEMNSAIHHHDLDFLITDPVNYIRIDKTGMQVVLAASVSERFQDKIIKANAGTIISLKKRKDLVSIKDLKGKHIAVSGDNDLDARYAVEDSLLEAGLNPKQDVAFEEYPGSGSVSIIDAVLSGRADAGVIAAGILENMQLSKNKIVDDLKVINKQDLYDFPYAVSTRLYPNDPLILFPYMSRETDLTIITILQSIPAGDALLKDVGIYKFGLPERYEQTENVMKELKVTPFDEVPEITVGEIWQKYKIIILVVFVSFLLLIVMAVILVSVNRILTEQRRQVQRNSEALARSTEQFQLAIRATKDGLWDWDLMTNEVYFSPRWKEMLGYDDREIENSLSSWERLVDPEGRKTTLKLVAESIRGERDGFEIEFRMRHKNGDWVEVLSRCILLRDEHGNAIRMVGTHVDITRKKSLELRLIESEKQSNLIIDTSPNAIIVADEKNNIIRMNPQVVMLFGYTKEELMGKPVNYLVSQDIINMRLIDDDGNEVKLSENQFDDLGVDNERIYASHRSGVKIPCEIGVAPVSINSKRHTIITINDISTRIKAASELERQNALLNTIIESMPMRVYWKTRELEYLGCNSLFASDVGFEEVKDVVGKSDEEIGWYDSNEAIQEEDRKIIETGDEKINCVEQKLDFAGNQKWLRTSKIPLIDASGNVVGLMGIYQDITEERDSEDKLRNFRNMLDQIHDCVFMFDAVNLKFTYVNKSGIEQVGYDENVIHEMHPYDIKPNYTEQQFKEMIKPMLRGEISFHHFETVHRYRAGKDIPVDIYLQLVKSVDGERNFIAVVRDVSERKSMETELINHRLRLEEQVAARTEELQQVTAYNRMLFETSPIGLLLCDMAGRFIDMNPQFLNIIGYTEDEARSLSYWDVTPKEYESQEQVQLDMLSTTGHYGPYEKEYIHKSGRRVPIRLNGLIIEKDGKKFILSAIEDVSELKSNELRLNTIIENLPAMFFMKNAQGQYMMVNRQYEEAIGIRKSHVIGLNDYEIFESEVADALTNQDRLVLGSQIPVAFEEKVPHIDGSDHDYLTTKVPLFDDLGQVYAMFGIATDVTHIKKLQSELSRAQSIGHMGSWRIDLRKNVYTWSEEACRIFGVEKSEHINFDKFMEYVYPDDREFVVQSWQKALTGAPYDIEHRIVVGSQIKWVLEQAEVTFDEKHQPIATMGIVLDITERKLSEAKLRDAEERYRSLFAFSQDAIMTLSPPSWRFNSTNSAAMKLFGVKDEEEYIKLALWDVSPELQPDGSKSKDKAKQMIKRAMRNGSHMFEWLHRKHDGSEFPATVLFSYVEIGGESLLQATIRDISAAKATEKAMLDARHKAENLAKTKSEFLANMSHEIRTPINSVIGMARIGERKSKSAENADATQYFKRIVTSGEHLLGVINDILDYSKLEAGKLKVDNQKTFNLAELIKGVMDMLNGVLEQKNLGFATELPDNLPSYVQGDPQRLRQILMNLLSNAVKFTEKGKVSLIVNRIGHTTYFKVSDTGIGISPRKISELFVPFEQLDGSNTREYGGTGLGLVISKKLAEAMGGDISVESFFGVGSTFTLVLPLPDSSPDNVVKPTMRQRHDGKQLAGISVLAVDDVEDNRLILEDILVQEGARVDFAENGAQAVEKVERAGDKDYDVVLMDVQMPIMDGYEATKRIQKSMPDLPVIGLTAHAMESERLRCLDAGMVEHVTKPIEPDYLLSVMHKYIHQKVQSPTYGDDEVQNATPQSLSESEKGEMIWPTDGPVDFDDGLARVRGNEKLYRQLLRNFVKRWSEFPAQLDDLLNRAEWNDILRTVHTLKGGSGNIGAKGLFTETAAFEEVCFARDEDRVREAFEEFRVHLEAVISSLNALPARQEKGMSQGETGGFSDEDNVIFLFERLIYFLDNDLGQAKACLARIKQLKVDGPILAAVYDIEAAMRNFDNDAAKTIVKRVQTA